MIEDNFDIDEVIENQDLIILGSNIGTADAWDQVTDTALYFYDVELNDLGKKLILNHENLVDLYFDYMNGIIATYDNNQVEKQYKINWTLT